MTGLPEDPTQYNMMACLVCDTWFYQANAIFTPGIGVHEVICPHPLCGASEWDFGPLLEDEVGEMFRLIVGHNFTEVRQTNLAAVARYGMGPINPLSRLI